MPRMRWVLLPAVVALATATTALAQAAVHTSRSPAGFTGSRITLDSNAEFSGYDALTTPDATTYVGWISSHSGARQLHLCVLPLHATACQGGVQTGDAIGGSSATDLRLVDAGGNVKLIWIYQPGASSGDFSGGFGMAGVVGGSLTGSIGIPGAPTNGHVTSVIANGSDVSIAAIGSSSRFDTAYYYSTISSSPSSVKAPFPIGNAQIATAGSKTVMTVSHYGSIGDPVRYASKGSGGWSGLSKVKGTWTLGNIERLIGTRSGVRLVAATDNATYQPVVAKWTGSGFGKPVHTGDRNPCAPASHDLVVDASGRIADVTNSCGKLAISNLAGTTTAGITRVPEGGTAAGGPPQISTVPSGRGWVSWGIESSGTGNNLYARPILLPALERRAHDRGKAGRLTLTGPASCMPVSSAPISLQVKPAHPWSVASKKVRLGGHKVGRTLNGGSLKPSTSYTLVGSATLKTAGHRARLRARLSFKTCGRP